MNKSLSILLLLSIPLYASDKSNPKNTTPSPSNGSPNIYASPFTNVPTPPQNYSNKPFTMPSFNDLNKARKLGGYQEFSVNEYLKGLRALGYTATKESVNKGGFDYNPRVNSGGYVYGSGSSNNNCNIQ